MELTAITTVTELRLPERLDRAALATLRSGVDAFAGASVAVVRGASDDVFCRGLSFDIIGEVADAERIAGLLDFEHAVLALVTSSTRTIARVLGDAAGGGLGVASACDVVIAGESSRFALPETLFGLIPGLVLPLIRSRIGGPALRRLALAGDSIDAREAWRLGLVDEVVADATMDARVSDWMRRLARADAAASGRLKTWLAELDDLEHDAARGREHLAELLGSAMVAERVGRYQRGLAPWQDEDGTT